MAADIPAATLQRLAPLRDAAANADTAADSDVGAVASASAPASGPSAAGTAAEAAPSEPSTARAGAAEGTAASHATPARQARRRARSAPQRGIQQLIEPAELGEESTNAPATAAVQAQQPTPVAPEVQPAAQEPAPALRTEVTAPLAPVSNTSSVTAVESTSRVALQANDFTPVLSPPLVVESGLAPITEALIKILVLKVRQGALSEGKAFELLDAVRLL